MEHVFISYNNLDADRVIQFCNELRKRGIVPWRYPQQLSDADWQNEIPKVISRTSATIVFWTPNSVASKLVSAEANLAKKDNKLIQVLLGVPPPFPFSDLPGDDLAATNFADAAWYGFVNLVELKLVKDGWNNAPTAGVGTDWISWCAANRHRDLDALADYAIKCGVIFLYGAEQWSGFHLQALSRITMTRKHIVHSDPDARILERMLEFNENKMTEWNMPFVSHLSELNALLAATAYTFASEVDFVGSPEIPLAIKSALSNPVEFVEVYFRSTLRIKGESISPSRIETADECFRFFFEFVTHMLDSVPKTAQRYVVVWPLKLIDDLLTNAGGSLRGNGKDLLRKPEVFATQLMEGVRKLAESPLQGRVGFIIDTSRFPCKDNATPVAKRCVVVAPPLSIDEIRDLALQRFPNNTDSLNFDAIFAATGGIWHWLDYLFDSYAHVLASPMDNGSDAMDRVITYLRGYLREPNAAREATGAQPPAWILQELQQRIQQARSMDTEMHTLTKMYAPKFGRSSTVENLRWNETYDPLISKTFASLVSRGIGGENPVSKFQVFSNYPYVSYAPMPGFVAALSNVVNHNVAR